MSLASEVKVCNLSSGYVLEEVDSRRTGQVADHICRPVSIDRCLFSHLSEVEMRV